MPTRSVSLVELPVRASCLTWMTAVGTVSIPTMDARKKANTVCPIGLGTDSNESAVKGPIAPSRVRPAGQLVRFFSRRQYVIGPDDPSPQVQAPTTRISQFAEVTGSAAPEHLLGVIH